MPRPIELGEFAPAVVSHYSQAEEKKKVVELASVLSGALRAFLISATAFHFPIVVLCSADNLR